MDDFDSTDPDVPDPLAAAEDPTFGWPGDPEWVDGPVLAAPPEPDDDDAPAAPFSVALGTAAGMAGGYGLDRIVRRHPQDTPVAEPLPRPEPWADRPGPIVADQVGAHPAISVDPVGPAATGDLGDPTAPSRPSDVPGSGHMPTAEPGRRVAHDRAALVQLCVELDDLLPNAALREKVRRGLRRAGVAASEPVGARFDPEQHRAVGTVATSDPALVRTIESVERPGFRDGGVELRPPDVVVYVGEEQAGG